MTRHAWRIDDVGLWVIPSDESENLSWTPACDLDGDDAPDPLSTPALPFPFSDAQLAAWMLEGWGAILQEAVGGWDFGPDAQACDALGVQGAAAVRALKRAYDAYRAAATKVGPVDPGLASAAEAARFAYKRAKAEAVKSHNWRESQTETPEKNVGQDPNWREVWREARGKRPNARPGPGHRGHGAASENVEGDGLHVEYMDAVRPFRNAYSDALRAFESEQERRRRAMVCELLQLSAVELPASAGAQVLPTRRSRALTANQERDLANDFDAGTSVAALALKYVVSRRTIDAALARQGKKIAAAPKTKR